MAMEFGLFYEMAVPRPWTARVERDAGCDQLLCLMNPYAIPADKVMRSIELFGEHVLPAFGDA